MYNMLAAYCWHSVAYCVSFAIRLLSDKFDAIHPIYENINNYAIILTNNWGVALIRIYTPTKICVSQKKTLASNSKHPNLTMHLLRFFLLLVLFLVFHYVGNIHVCLTPTPSPLPPSSSTQ